MEKSKSKLSKTQEDEILKTLKDRFGKNPCRHIGVPWEEVFERLEGNQEKLWSLKEMEVTGGEPDVVEFDKK